MIDYKQLVMDLLNTQKEGDYWDFKRKHHENVADLVKDIICLANVQVRSDRYLVFGVDDDFTVVGISDSENRRSQSDIICVLRDSSFARGVYPDIYLNYLPVLDIDLLIIKNRPEKPYFLIKDKNHQGKIVRSGVVYSRSRDSNTPNNRTASYEQIEYMWREQFGLTLAPVERMEILLLDAEGWFCDLGNIDYGYYKQSPEYNFKIIDQDKIDDYINFFFTNSTTFIYKIIFKYHTTILFELIYIGADENREVFPYPDIGLINSEIVYYYFNLESRSGKFLKFLSGLNHNSLRFRNVEPFLIFKDRYEKSSFEEYLTSNLDLCRKMQQSSDLLISKKDERREKLLSYECSWKMYKLWKDSTDGLLENYKKDVK